MDDREIIDDNFRQLFSDGFFNVIPSGAFNEKTVGVDSVIRWPINSVNVIQDVIKTLRLLKSLTNLHLKCPKL